MLFEAQVSLTANIIKPPNSEIKPLFQSDGFQISWEILRHIFTHVNTIFTHLHTGEDSENPADTSGEAM